jgi:pSer/pThr/pTyr-binding forkhead associated (FHA) protein|tara:strand:- start:1 stop:696 length:696 start_codon:yes stop_codon:yes gene_type:complete
MDKLVLKFKDKVIKECPITGDQIKIGRDEDNDIVIDNAAVSRHHAKIKRAGDGYVVEDLGSTNGTFVNENRITQQEKLQDGDIVIVGKHSILLESEFKVETQAGADFGGTMILDTKQQHELLNKQRKATVTPVEEKQAKLIVVQSGERKEYKITKDVTVIGKSHTSDVVLNGLLIPQMVATIKKEGKSFYISGYGGWIQVNVNGRILGKKWKLYPNDTIEVRKVKIIFEYK